MWGWAGVGGRRYLEVRQAVLEEDVPVVEEERLLTDTQQARHEGIQGLGRETPASTEGEDSESKRERAG